MNITMRLISGFAILLLAGGLPTGPVFAQADAGKAIMDKLTAKVAENLTARVAKLERACAKDIRKYCRYVTPGEGRMVYCMQAHEDKISPQCVFELEEASTTVLATTDALKDAVVACKAEIAGVCGKTLPGQGRVAACLLANRSTASTGCAEAIKKIETLTAE
jgi:hypothetical protein